MMRDIHGRYLDTKNIEDNGPEWAAGCGRCACGIASSPPLTGVVSLHLERLAQAINKELAFCECTAGVRYRSNLLNMREKLIEQARKDPRMQEQARRKTHPEIEMAQQKMLDARLNTPAPPMHFEEQPVYIPMPEGIAL